jgi:glycosyltransferase involved in cell wall biosynthesis
MAAKIRVQFLIPSLVAHGAERQLCELVRNMDRERFEVHVVVFYDPGHYVGGELGPEIATLPGVTLHYLHKRRGALGNLLMLPRLHSLTWRIDPQLIHGYLDGNLPALLVGRALRKAVVWGVRQSHGDGPHQIRSRLGSLMTRLARHVDLIIFNSEKGRSSYEKIGMRGRRSMVIPNGFDIERFIPDPVAGAEQRRDWGVPGDAPLIGIVGRFATVKDHPTFLRAAVRIAKEWPEARFICIGSDPDRQADDLKAMAAGLGLSDRVLWPGICTRMPAAYNALTLLVLTSTDEGFPNVIGEAMACGVPCVSTRAGDAAPLVADTGVIAEIGDDEAIATGVWTLLRESGEVRERRSRSARSRICTTFSVQALAKNTEEALVSLLPRVQAGMARPGAE